MKTFFSYYGGKWRGAMRYGPPRHDLVIEPFAGSACYSTRWEHPNVRLYDLSDDVCAAWEWLIHCSDDDVRDIPDDFLSNEEWAALPDGPRQVVYWNVGFGEPRMGKSLKSWYLHYTNTGERIGRLKSRKKAGGADCWWNRSVKARILRQKPLIRNWTIERLDYRDIPIEEAHWHVDPPYQDTPGRSYQHNKIDFDHLGEWCKSLPGAVDVCENDGADWLSFKPLYAISGMRGKRTKEVVWRKNSGELFPDL